jgi:hypothetical protein
VLNAEAVLQAELRDIGVNSIHELPTAAIVDLALRYAIWLPTEVFVSAPWVAPYAVRRNRIRTDPFGPGEKRDMWGLPSLEGYFTDDNSLIKPIAARRQLQGLESPYGASKVSSGLVCCHVWPLTTTSPLLFSFVPNLVWLPRSLAPLTDAHLPGTPHPLHETLKSVALGRYRHVAPGVGLDRTERAWALLENVFATRPSASRGTEVAEVQAVVDLVHKRVRRLVEFLEATIRGSTLPKRFSKRYHAGFGGGIDLTVLPVQDALSVEVREALIVDMLSCLPKGPQQS